ncbi:hypothetical protein [Paenibacillus hamazuiensis]|uniref:hypothetical protein n=1 Tax=Paenibacillus hamazuiensis TaxID=2936508 RepID=UPI0020106672|nr:hypothetical protein [Paenibacillus hamazuiensis]
MRTHLGYSPFGIYQEAFTTNFPKQFIMYDARLMHTRFEAIGNAAIYSENWNIGVDGGGILNSRFENVGFSWNSNFKLPQYPRDYAVKIGHCTGINYYYPGASGFQKGDVNSWYVHMNDASWFGGFQMEDFDFGPSTGYPSALFPEKQNATVTNAPVSGEARLTVIKQGGTAGNHLKPYATIYIGLTRYVGIPGSPQKLNLPKNLILPYGNISPIPLFISANSTGLPNSNIMITSTSRTNQSIQISVPDSKPITGFIKIEGALP